MIRCEGRKMLVRKVLRRSSRAGDLVGWKTGRGPGWFVSSWLLCGDEMKRIWFLGRMFLTVFSPRWCAGEGAGLGNEAPEAGAAVVG